MFVLKNGESEREFFQRIERGVLDCRDLSAQNLAQSDISVWSKSADLPYSLRERRGDVAVKFSNAYIKKRLNLTGMSIEILQFEHCFVSDEAASQIAEFIRNSQELRVLKLAYGKISKEGLLEIMEACQNARQLEILSFAAGKNWQIPGKLKIFGRGLDGLRILNFTNFKNLSAETFGEVVDFIRKSSSLLQLTLNGIYLNEGKVSQLFDAIAASGFVKRFAFDAPKLNFHAAFMISEKMSNCDSLNHLELPEILNDYNEICAVFETMIKDCPSIFSVKAGNAKIKETFTKSNQLKIKDLYLKNIIRFYPTSQESEIFSEVERRFLWENRDCLKSLIGESEIFQLVTSLRKLIPAAMHRILTSEPASEILRDSIKNAPVLGENREDEAYARRALRNYYLSVREKILKGQFGSYMKNCLVEFEKKISGDVGLKERSSNIELDYKALTEPQIYELMQKNPDEYDASDMASMLYEADLGIYEAFKKQESFKGNCPKVHEQFFDKMQEFVSKHSEAIKSCEFLSEDYQQSLRSGNVRSSGEVEEPSRRVRRRFGEEGFLRGL